MTTYFPVQIVFRNLEHSDAVESSIRKHAEKLGCYFDHIMSCHVVIEMPLHQHKGNIYHVGIDLIVPDLEIAVNRDPGKNHAHENIYVAIRDAFNAAKRQLKQYTDKRHGDIKHHDGPRIGLVREIAPLADYGFIETLDGRQIRFSSNSVIDYDFSKLEVGDRVTFIEVESNDGTAASTVYVN